MAIKFQCTWSGIRNLWSDFEAKDYTLILFERYLSSEKRRLPGSIKCWYLNLLSKFSIYYTINKCIPIFLDPINAYIKNPSRAQASRRSWMKNRRFGRRHGLRRRSGTNSRTTDDLRRRRVPIELIGARRGRRRYPSNEIPSVASEEARFN